MKKNETYQSALAELQGLVDQLQSNEIAIDELAERVERAKTLIAFCREKLRNTEVTIDQLLGDDA